MLPEIREALGTPEGFQPTLVGGEAAVEHDTGPIIEDDLAAAEMIVLPVALLVLLLFFGSVVSALLPLLMAGATIMLAFAGTYIAGQGMEIADLVTNVITLVGVAIGVNYALLVVSRFREEMARGADRVEATGRTMATAGRAVMLSGVTVAIGLAVLVALPVPFIRSMGIGGMLVPASAVLTGLTLLPAVLCALGPRVNALRVYPRRWRLREGAVWGPLAKAVTGLGRARRRDRARRHRGARPPGAEDEHPPGPARRRARRRGRPGRPPRVGRARRRRQPRRVRHRHRARRRRVRPRRRSAPSHGVADDLRAQHMVSGVTWPDTTDPAAFRAAAQDGLVDADRPLRPDERRAGGRPRLRLGAGAERRDARS